MTVLAGTTAHIDLTALVANYRLLAAKSAQAQCSAVVKANAYGLGAEKIGETLYAAGCREFFVATVAEGIALRAALPDAAIGVFYGMVTQEDVRACLQHGLLPSLNSMHQLALWREAARQQGKRLPACVHVDTGMTRLGISQTELERLATEPELLEGLDGVLLMTHLACAGDAEHPLNQEQLERFTAARAVFPTWRTSFANSSGVFLGEDFHGDLMRPGAALYGINPIAPQVNPMRPVVTISAPILQLRQLEKPEVVGYNATYRAPKGAWLATLGGGYADGLLRSMSGNARVFIAGYEVPLAGIVSMDLIVVDVSGVPEGLLQPGDRAEFIGANVSVDEAAERAGTIGYELLTSISGRVQRIYL